MASKPKKQLQEQMNLAVDALCQLLFGELAAHLPTRGAACVLELQPYDEWAAGMLCWLGALAPLWQLTGECAMQVCQKESCRLRSRSSCCGRSSPAWSGPPTQQTQCSRRC